MVHFFDTDIAEKYGINAAILLQNIGYWTKINEANNINYFDGAYWTYNSRKAYKKLFPYMSERQIFNALQKLIDNDIIITGHYSKLAYDRTLWYALTQKGKCILHFDTMDIAKMSNGYCENVKPITDINSYINNNNNIIYNNIDENFEKLWKMLKSTPYDRKSKVSAKRRKELLKMGDRAVKAIELYNEVQNPQYLHRRDNFLNEIINNYLDKEVSDFTQGQREQAPGAAYDLELFEEMLNTKD